MELCTTIIFVSSIIAIDGDLVSAIQHFSLSFDIKLHSATVEEHTHSSTLC